MSLTPSSNIRNLPNLFWISVILGNHTMSHR